MKDELNHLYNVGPEDMEATNDDVKLDWGYANLRDYEFQVLDVNTGITSDELGKTASTEQGNQGLIPCWWHGTPFNPWDKWFFRHQK